MAAVLLMLYLGVTGSIIQAIDLYTLAQHLPETDPVMLSINEGRFGNGDTQVINDADFAAAPLPATLDYGKAFDGVLQAMRRQTPDAKPNFVELRMSGDRVIGQAREGKTVQAFDPETGGSVKPVSTRAMRLPHSFRETLKEWHRFWTRRDVPGVWFELLSGVVMWVLIISGLWMYFQLLSARRKIGRNQLFWMSGGTWKALHRVISLGAAVLLVCVAFSGTWLGFESVYHTFASKPGPPAPQAGALGDDEVRQMAGATLAQFRKLEPQTPIKVLRVRLYGTAKEGAVVTGGAETRQILLDPQSGQIHDLNAPGFPASGFPWGTQTHENIKHFHSGYLLGYWARVLDLVAGLSLVYLAVSGVVMYADLYLRRRKNGRGALVWL
jgi:uncharacterized iron-regulated membrane protein